MSGLRLIVQLSRTPASSSASTDGQPLSIEMTPGGVPVRLEARITNVSRAVLDFQMTLEGLKSDWYSLDPKASLFPGDATTLQFNLHPPSQIDVQPGRYPFKVRAIPDGGSDEGDVGLAEGSLIILGSPEFQIDLEHKQVRAQRRGEFVVLLTNLGYVHVTLDLRFSSADAGARHGFDQERVILRAGAPTARIGLWVESDGQPDAYPFKVWAQVAHDERD